VAINSTVVDHNLVRGGDGDVGGDGGNGLGGGVFSDAGSTMSVNSSQILQNNAQGGLAGTGGSSGQGQGGGVYNLGMFSADDLTVIANNHASISDPNCFGC